MILKHLNGALALTKKQEKRISKLIKESNGSVEGLSDKGVLIRFQTESDAYRFERYVGYENLCGLSISDID